MRRTPMQLDDRLREALRTSDGARPRAGASEEGRSRVRRIPLLLIGLAAALSLTAPARAQDSFTLYELLEPGSARFKITYDVSTARAGSEYYLNAIRAGSVATDESIIDLATGKELVFEVITGAQAKEQGLASPRTPDDNEYIKVHLGRAIPEGGEARLRIIKTDEDPASYMVEGDTVIFDRGLGIRANAVVLPPGYELIESRTPGMVSTRDDGRIKISFLNDRDDQLAVRVVGRRIGSGGGQ